MRIQWVLPPEIGPGIGGYVVVYGYANRLAERGHEVTVVHLTPLSLLRGMSPRQWLHALAWLVKVRLTTPGGDYRPDPRLRRVSRFRLSRRSCARAEAVVATSWRTAGPVAAVARPGTGCYFIQHHETWDGAADEVAATWRLPLRRIVIAEWLAEVAEQLDALPVAVAPNAIDGAVHRMVTPPEERAAASVAMLWHRKDWKRSADGLAALELVHRQVPELVVDAFSVFPRPAEAPEYVRWHEAATPEEVARLLNDAAVFLSPSEAEGWGLPATEALACGCALVSTDIGGVRDYAHEGRTALLVDVGDVPAMAAAVLRLVRDDELRLRLAHAGADLVAREFTWDRAVERLEGMLAERTPATPVVAAPTAAAVPA